jgi:hypothetical protein
MEYVKLTQLDNQYPSVSSYTTDITGSIRLSGIYDNNAITFDKVSLNSIIVIPNTSFRFVIQLTERGVSNYYTSQVYFNDMSSSLVESNPYFVNESLKPYAIVKLDTSPLYKINQSLKQTELDNSATISKNVFFISGSNGTTIDSELYIKYIDWVVSDVSSELIESGGVIPWDTPGMVEYYDSTPLPPYPDTSALDQFYAQLVSPTDGSSPGFIYWSRCKENWPWPFNSKDRDNEYAWWNGPKISIANNTTTDIVVRMALTGSAAIQKVFSVSQPNNRITIPANTLKTVSVLDVNKFEVDKLIPTQTLGGFLSSDRRYSGNLILKTDAHIQTIPISIYKQEGSTFDYNSYETT